MIIEHVWNDPCSSERSCIIMSVLWLQLVGNNEPLKIDEASLTGESLAVNKKTGDSVLSGAVVEQGESEAIVTAVGENTFFGKTIKLLSRPEEKGHLQQVRFLSGSKMPWLWWSHSTHRFRSWRITQHLSILSERHLKNSAAPICAYLNAMILDLSRLLTSHH